VKLRCDSCHSHLASKRPDRIVTVRCQRCREWHAVQLDGERGDVRCEGKHPRLEGRNCNAILLRRLGRGQVTLHCRRCGEPRPFPSHSTVLLDGGGCAALGSMT